VYAGAIVVLFLFVIMLVNLKDALGPRVRVHATVSAIVGAATTILLVYVAVSGGLKSSYGRGVDLSAQGGNLQQVGWALYGDYLLPFEIASILLLVAMIGAIVLARQKYRGDAVPIPPHDALVFSLLLFSVGVAGVLTRRNAIIILMSIELMMNAANINFIAFGLRLHNITGQVFSVFTIAVAAGEVAVGLAVVLALFRNRDTVYVDQVHIMKG
jgi:NADH-quinone oxidoreductase subunit K